MRVGLVVALGLLAAWVGLAAVVEDQGALQPLGGLFGFGIVAWGLLVQFGGRCPRCGRRLVPQARLQIPPRCPYCGTDFGRAG